MDKTQKKIQEAAERFWKKSLEGADFLLELPKTSTQLREDQRMPKSLLTTALAKQLRAFAKKEKIDLSNVLQSAFAGFLYRYTMQEDFVIGFSVDRGPSRCVFRSNPIRALRMSWIL